MLCRRSDSQLSEVDFLVKRFGELGTEAHRVYPDEATGDDHFTAHGKTFDFVYRHLFVHRLSETPHPFLEAFFAGEAGPDSLLFNHPAAHVEAKSNFALLSRALEEPALAEAAALGPDELAAIRRSVPWTRVLAPGESRGPSGEALPDLVAHVAAHPESFVLKRAWDYGGKAVFVGPASGEPGFATRAEAAFGARLEWPDLVRRAADGHARRGLRRPGGGGHPARAAPAGDPTGPVEAEVFVDYSVVRLGGGRSRSRRGAGWCALRPLASSTSREAAGSCRSSRRRSGSRLRRALRAES